MKSPGRIVILGAGPCGLGAAYRLRENGYDDFAVYDRAPRPGGTADSVPDGKGFVWDLGCHVVFSRSSYFNGVMDRALPGGWIEHRRDSRVRMFGQLVPYPMQHNLHRLPSYIASECAIGIKLAAARRPKEEPLNFRDWILNGLGDGIARHFMLPYNEKIWTVPLDSMGVGWIRERVPEGSTASALEKLAGSGNDRAWGPNAIFRYPRNGGIGAAWRAVAGQIGMDRINLGREATLIDPRLQTVAFDDGSLERYDALISTLPLGRLVELSGMDSLRSAAATLSSSTVHAVGIGIRGCPPDDLAGTHWLYSPDKSLPYYRVSVLSNFSRANAPAGHWSLLAEVARNPRQPSVDGKVVDDVIDGAIRDGFIPSGSEIASRFHRLIEPAYPIPALTRNGALAAILPALESVNIFSRGRFGAWRYEIGNQDHSFLQGAEIADRLVLGHDERTICA